MECVAILQPAGVPILVILQLGRDTSQVSACLEYHRGGRSKIDQEIKMSVKSVDMTSLQTVSPLSC